MVRKSLKSRNSLAVLDIDSALRGTTKIFKEKNITDVDLETDKILPHHFIKDIRQIKSYSMLDKEDAKKAWSSFIVLRMLSMNDNDVDTANLLNQYQDTMSPEELYYCLSNLIDYDSTYYEYISTKTSTSEHPAVKYVSRYYEIPKEQAQEYIDIMGDEWAENIQSQYENTIIKG
jgi:hypothetical protein